MRSNDALGSQLAGVVVLDLDVFVGLVVHGVEHHRHNSRTVHVDRDGREITCKLEVLEEVHQPLSFLGSGEQRGILGVVGARSHESMKFGEPGALRRQGETRKPECCAWCRGSQRAKSR